MDGDDGDITETGVGRCPGAVPIWHIAMECAMAVFVGGGGGGLFAAASCSSSSDFCFSSSATRAPSCSAFSAVDLASTAVSSSRNRSPGTCTALFLSFWSVDVPTTAVLGSSARICLGGDILYCTGFFEPCFLSIFWKRPGWSRASRSRCLQSVLGLRSSRRDEMSACCDDLAEAM